MNSPDPIEIEEMIKLLNENISQEEAYNDQLFRYKILKMFRATAMATYFNYQQICQLRKSISWIKFLVTSVLLLIVLNLIFLKT